MEQTLGFKLLKPTAHFLRPGTFLKKFTYTDDYERQHVRQTANLARRNQTRIHLLVDADHTPHGFIALSVSHLLDQPCVVVDYLFVSKQHRGVAYLGLGGKISEHLIDFAIMTASEINDKVPIRYIALLPGHVGLVSFYGIWGFTSLDKTGWMFLKI
jgi:hypothetical protein